MKTRLLLFALFLTCGVLNAQGTIRSLVISEVRLDDARHSYVEITNVGATTLNLAQFEIGIVGPRTNPIELLNIDKWFNVGENYWFMLPDKNLAPNKSFLIGGVYDWNPEQWLKDPTKGTRVMNKKEFWTLSDINLHFPESPNNDPTDSITPYYHVLDAWNGRDCIYLRHHLSPTDSVVIDQVNGIFDEADGTSRDAAHNVAGVTNASNNSTLVRKFSVKSGNVDFASAAGVDFTDSEWLPIPRQWGGWEQHRSLFWTVGNHGDFNLNETTLTSNTIDINWIDTILIVPWGVRRDDSLMFQFDRQPGFGWHFNYAKSHEDSAYYSLRTGDMMTIYACGNDMDMANFKITVAPPTTGANIVVPKNFADEETGFYSAWPPTWVVTDKVTGMDTIMEIPFGIRSDTLLKYLEKAPNASWEFEWVDGNVRTDLKTGDILKVTAENSNVKRYYIKPDKYQKSHNASLASITWPDIPEFYKGLYGWVGDTIPNFTSSKYDFKVQIPFDVDGIPALIGKTSDVNAKVEVERAKNLTGSIADRTVTFRTTAVDDTSKLSYKVLLEKEKEFIQPWIADPFLTQLVFQDQWSNYFVEFTNPGTEALDFSNYMVVFDYTKIPSEAITWNNATTEWANRYVKYIPGYKWQSEAEWGITPRIAAPDVNVSPIVQPGDVFVIGSINTTWALGYPWWASEQVDIDFGHNPWGETIGQGNAAGQWWGGAMFMFKILNDSIKLGLKPATDPLDFELLETWGDDDEPWIIGGVPAEQTATWIRKPEYYLGKTGLGESFGTDTDNSEWLFYNRAYWQAQGVGWVNDIMFDCQGLGSHFMDEVTMFKSTVSSNIYKVSDGYFMDEQISGVITGTTVAEFLANLIKANEGQTLTMLDGVTTLLPTDVVTNGNTLMVVSLDTNNTSKYVLEVTADGLSSDAVLVSTEYTVNVTGATGTISGFEYGTSLRVIVENVTNVTSFPFGASFGVIDGNDEYVPLVLLNYDTLLVDVQVSADVYFEVIAEDGVTKILYQLLPNTMNSGAFVTSNIFEVDQLISLINLVPEGTAVGGLMKYLIPAPGATVKLVDKLGYDRIIGVVAKDDRIIVTSEDGLTTKTYYLKVLGDDTSYLAYVLSDVYSVDQLEFSISGSINVLMTINTFLANLTAAENATMVVTNGAGVAQTGNLDIGDKLVVTAGDGVTIVTYTIGVGTAVGNLNSRLINVYPNPSTGMIYVSGLEAGNRVFVSNMLGQRMIDRVVRQNTEMINLIGQSAGIYFVTVNNGDKVVGRYKLILQ